MYGSITVAQIPIVSLRVGFLLFPLPEGFFTNRDRLLPETGRLFRND